MIRGWSKSAILHSGNLPAGTTTPGSTTYNPKAANSVLNCSLQADFEIPGTYTIQFSIGQSSLAIAPSTLGGVISPIADITWSVKGNAVRRRINISNGTQISGTGEAVHVTVSDINPMPAFPTPGGYNAAVYPVGILVTPGVRATTPSPPIYIPYITDPVTGAIVPGAVTLAPGGSVTVPIPEDSGITSVLANADFSAAFGFVGPWPRNAFQLTQDTAGSGAGKIYSIVDPLWLPLPPNCPSITLNNNLAAGAGNSSLFSVTFGVDG